jgi:hypothetical protein
MAMKLHGRRDSRRGNQHASRRACNSGEIEKLAAHQWNICALPG